MSNKKEITLNYDEWKYKGHVPYSWMVDDLYRGIQTEQNYLVALGLICYSEAIGRNILETRGKKGGGTEAFKAFTKDYIGYQFNNWNTLYGYCRNGLAHEYFIKGGKSSILNDSGNMPRGIEIRENDKYSIYINSYFRDFVKGLTSMLDKVDSVKN